MAELMYVAWKPEQHSVGHPDIDRQHMKILDILNTLYQTVQKDQGTVAFQSVFNELQEYSKEHFRLEEKLMEIGGYPELSVHQNVHRKYNDKVQELKKQYEKTFGDIFAELFTFMRDWWLNHIQTTDRKYIPFVSTTRMP